MFRSTTPRPQLWLLALTMLALIALVVPAATQASPAKAVPSGLLLWNKLGSDDEVANSEYGPDLATYDCSYYPCGLDVIGTLGHPAGVFGGAASITGRPVLPWPLGCTPHSSATRS